MSPSERLVREHHALVYSAALRVLGDAAAAEDVAQDVFLKVLERPRILDDAENLRAFLARSAINRALDVVRERDRRERREQATVPQPREADPVESAWWSELRERVDELPEEERRAIDLRFYRGLTVREAAQSLNVSTGTVCNRLATALSRLKKLIGAAAFGALASVCLGGEAPAGVEERLVSRVTRRRRWSRRATGAAAIAAAILFAVWVAQPEPEAPKSWTVRGEMAKQEAATPQVEASRPADPPAAGASGEPPSKSAAAAPMIELEGFLFADGHGLALSDPCWKDGVTVQALRRLDGDALADLPASPATSFAPFLRRVVPASAAPQVRVRVAGPGNLARIAVAEVISVERLGEPWLLAWRDLVDASRSLAAALDTTPGAARRFEIVSRAEDFRLALERARAARAGDPVVEWREAREMEATLDAAIGLGIAGHELAPDVRGILRMRRALEAYLSQPDVPVESLATEPLTKADADYLGIAAGLVIVSVRGDRFPLEPGDILWRVGPASGGWWDSASSPELLGRALDFKGPIRLRVLRGSASLSLDVAP